MIGVDGGQGDFGLGFGPMIGPGAVLVRYRKIGGNLRIVEHDRVDSA